MFVFVFGGEKQKVSQKMEVPTIALQKVGSHFSFFFFLIIITFFYCSGFCHILK